MDKKFEDFTGRLVKIEKLFLRRNHYYLYLQNDEKQIKVISGGDYVIGSKMKISHIGKQLINIRSVLLPGCDSQTLEMESYFCNLYNREIEADECSDTQEIRRKPGEVEILPFNLENANSFCPKCPFNRCR